MAELTSGGAPTLKLSIDKAQERKNIIESAFILFVRRASMISPSAAIQLLNEVLDDNALNFLHNACFYLKSGCIEMRTATGSQDSSVPESLMSCLFNIKSILSFSVETKELKRFNKAEKMRAQYEEYTRQPLPTGENTVIRKTPEESSISHEDLSNYISEKIAELFEGKASLKSSATKPSGVVYVVKKVFTDSGISSNIRICNTEEEAINFVKKIVREYPELTRTCEFQVERISKKDNDSKKYE